MCRAAPALRLEPRRRRRHRLAAGVRHARRRQRLAPRRRRARPHRRDRIARGRADRPHGHQSRQQLLPERRLAAGPARRRVAAGGSTATSTRPRSARACSAARPPPTCSRSAPPCRPARCRSTQPASSGRSSSTASPCSRTSPPSDSVGNGRSTRPRSRPRANLEVRTPETLDQLIHRLEADLVDYQDADYADRFRRKIEEVRGVEQRVAPGSQALTFAAARHLHKLMAYKDEYEVARLALLPESQAQYEAVGGRRHQGHLPPAPADAAVARARPQDQVPPHRRAGVQGAALDEASARHARRPVPVGRGAPARAGDDPRVREGARHADRGAASRTTSTRPWRSRRCPIRCAATSTSSSSAPRSTAPS